ncbi:hypothetical protein NEOLEDRAFT_1057567, partial [Neolentinus lepideus HHB14362 ss-1]
LGVEAFEHLSEGKQSLLDLFVFGGCCGHKDLNSFKYGVIAMAAAWEESDQPPPVLLANKANDAVIQLSNDADSAADTDHQDWHWHFMAERKKELYGDTTVKCFPDTSNTRYQSHSYAATETITYHPLYVKHIDEICDGKVKPGENHLESNVKKGLECPSTLAELGAMSLYGVSVSWPYLREVQGDGAKLINLLDLTDLHCKLPIFCDHITVNPSLLLGPDSPLDQITIDRRPYMDEQLIFSLWTMIKAGDLLDLDLIISAMFAGAAKGWHQFTTEFAIGGPFDSLTAQEGSLLFIPSMNDANEGALGSFHVHVHYKPSSTTAMFSSHACS